MTNNVGKRYTGILDGDTASFVSLDAIMPDPSTGHSMDDMVVMGARVSYGQGLKDPEKDKKLIAYLMKNEHMSPFEQPQATFTMRLPKMAVIQLLRHRAFHFNSESGRYSEVKDEMYIPERWRLQSFTNKQMSGETIDDAGNDVWRVKLGDHARYSFSLYQEALNAGIAKELARLFLPGDGMYVTIMFTGDLRNLMHFMALRCDEHAQYEIRQAACAMYWLLAPHCRETLSSWLETISQSARNNIYKFYTDFIKEDNHVD